MEHLIYQIFMLCCFGPGVLLIFAGICFALGLATGDDKQVEAPDAQDADEAAEKKAAIEEAVRIAKLYQERKEMKKRFDAYVLTLEEAK